MKKRFFRFLLGILYIGLMIALLVVYVQNIAGKLERMFAITGTLALASSAVIILIFYVRLKNQEEAAEKEAARKKAEAGIPPDSENTSPPVPETAHKETNTPEILQMEDLEEKLAPFSLSRRETEVAWLLYRGYTNRQIAEELYIAETTVKKHATHIYEKMQVSGRKEYKEKLRNVSG